MLLGKPALKYEERAAAAKVEEEDEEDEIATQPRGRCFIVSYVLGTKSSLNRLLISLLLSCCSIFGQVKGGKHSVSLAKDAKVQLSLVEIYGESFFVVFQRIPIKRAMHSM